jgi:hypothetical protein
MRKKVKFTRIVAGFVGFAMALSMVGYPSSTVEFYGEGEATFDPGTDTTRSTNYNFGLTDSFDIKATGGAHHRHHGCGRVQHHAT